MRDLEEVKHLGTDVGDVPRPSKRFACLAPGSPQWAPASEENLG